MKESAPKTLGDTWNYEKLTRVVQDPVSLIKDWVNAGMNPVVHLVDSRECLKNDSSIKISKPHPRYFEFYRTPNDQQVFYDSLVTLLAESGISREEASKFLRSFIREEVSILDSAIVNKIFTMSMQAIDNVYGSVDRVIN